ncbi:dehydrodolichyl diphosphate synthase 6-like protein [Tanacetum coccineum]
MDGNRRYSKKNNLTDAAGYRVGYSTLMSMVRYCFEMGVKHVTFYAFSIDNFKRNPEEVQTLMELMEEKIERLINDDNVVSQYGVRVRFIGNLKLLSKPTRLAAERAMHATSGSNKFVLSICVAYTSTDEILHAVQESCEERWHQYRVLDDGLRRLDVLDIQKHMYMGVVPDPDVIIRTSGETRLSNFLLWQSSNCLLYSPSILWPEIGFPHLLQAVLEFQKHFYYLKGNKCVTE